jgi:pimeloyl-ACP methyl ester carboxylesterase
MDNRDIGLSQHFDHMGKPNLILAAVRYKLGLRIRPPYTLEDMARDALGVLDTLGVARAHIVGVSMGGMIAQRVAIAAPQRVISLTSIMSTSGAKSLKQAQPDVVRILIKRPASVALQDVVDHYVTLYQTIGSPGFPTPESELRERITRGVQRCYHPEGTRRQMLAILADITRAAQLSRISSPTLVLHGRADPLVPFEHGDDVASRISGARLVGIDGMGHDLPPEPVAQILDALIPHLQAVKA